MDQLQVLINQFVEALKQGNIAAVAVVGITVWFWFKGKKAPVTPVTPVTPVQAFGSTSVLGDAAEKQVLEAVRAAAVKSVVDKLK